MKLLVCAHDCKPGAENGAGWKWVEAFLRLGNQVHVLTAGRNREAILQFPAVLTGRIVVHDCDVPAWAQSWERTQPGAYFYTLLWQWAAYRLARELHALEKFDRVHHVTSGNLHQPSFMGGLGIPFVFGPVGAGEPPPAALMRSMSLRSRLAHARLTLSGAMLKLDPFMRATFARAHMIACTTMETMNRVPRAYRARCLVQLGTGIDETEITPAPLYDDAAPNFVYFGELIHGNGLHLAIDALARVRKKVPRARLRVIGNGPESDWLRHRAADAGVAEAIDWMGAAGLGDRCRVLHDSMALVFPSLCDAAGVAVLDALSVGLPVVCLDRGAPGVLATPDCACIVKTEDADETEVVAGLEHAMVLLATNSQLRMRLGAQALQRAKHLTWDRAAQAVCDGLKSLNRVA